MAKTFNSRGVPGAGAVGLSRPDASAAEAVAIRTDKGGRNTMEGRRYV